MNGFCFVFIIGKTCAANNLTTQNNFSETQVSQYNQSGKGDINCVHTYDKVICLKDDERKCLGNETSFLCVCGKYFDFGVNNDKISELHCNS